MARAPLAWYDSVVTTLAADPHGPLLARRGLSRAPGRPATRGVFGYGLGGFGLEEASLLLQSGDSLLWGEADVATWSRQEAEAYGPAGRHRWGVAGRRARGAHAVSAAFAQRGAAARLASFEDQSGRGESGRIGWTWSRRGRGMAAEVARAWDAHESAGPALGLSRRDADATRAALRAWLPARGGTLEARAAAAREDVRRDVDPEFDRRATSLAAGVSCSVPLGDGTLAADLAALRHEAGSRGLAPDTTVGERTRTLLAPEVAYRFGGGAAAGAVRAGRRALPVWSDLAPGQAPFLEDTWSYGLEARVAARSGSRAGAALLLGRTTGRAVLFRLPLEELWTRLGAVRDPAPASFALLTASAEWRARGTRIGVEGFALSRDRATIQPEVDPRAGFRGYLESRFGLFQNDLGVLLRGEVAGVGERESEAVVPATLPAFVTFGATVRFTLGSAMVVVRARNLEDRRRREPWVDLATGAEARGPGRAVETRLTWLLFD